MDGTSLDSAGVARDVQQSSGDPLASPSVGVAGGLEVDPGCERLHCLSEIHQSKEKRLIYVGDGKRDEIGLVENVINCSVDYAVWVAPDDPYRVRYMMTNAYLASTRKQENAEKAKQFLLLWNEVSVARHQVQALAADDRQTAKIAIDVLGNAVGAGLEFDTEAMANGIRHAATMVQDCKKRIMKLAYTESAVRTAFVFGSVATLGLLVSSDALDSVASTWVERVCLGVLGGTLGATISALSSFAAGSTIDMMAKTEHAASEGFYRIMFGVLCGCMAMLTVSSGLILGADVSAPALLLLAAVGGYAEKYVPNILTNLASSSSQNATPKTGGAAPQKAGEGQAQ